MKERGLLPLPAAPPSGDAWEYRNAVREGEEAPKWKRMRVTRLSHFCLERRPSLVHGRGGARGFRWSRPVGRRRACGTGVTEVTNVVTCLPSCDTMPTHSRSPNRLRTQVRS